MRALILCAGKGSRLYPLTHLMPKALVPIAGKPLIAYSLENLAAAGIKEIGIVVAPHNSEQFRQALGRGEDWGVELDYFIQEQPLGLAHALLTGKKYLEECSHFLVVLGDNLFGVNLKEFIDQYLKSGIQSQIMLVEVDDPRNYGVADVSGQKIVRLIEKPPSSESRWAVAGVYGFSPQIFEEISGIQPSARGELELTDAIQGQITRGFEVNAFFSDCYWHDIGNIAGLLEANRRFLSNLVTRIEGDTSGDCCFSGLVVVPQGCRLSNTRLKGPVLIGEGSSLDNCILGPNVVIGKSVKMSDCIVENSLILEGAHLEGLRGPVTGSVIGPDSIIIKKGSGWKTLVVGGHSRLII